MILKDGHEVLVRLFSFEAITVKPYVEVSVNIFASLKKHSKTKIFCWCRKHCFQICSKRLHFIVIIILTKVSVDQSNLRQTYSKNELKSCCGFRSTCKGQSGFSFNRCFMWLES